MSTAKGPRRWSPGLDFPSAFDTTIQFYKDCRVHGIPLEMADPALYRAFLVDGSWPHVEGQDLSRYLRFGKTGLSNHPSSDRTKQAIAKLLAVALKAHYFMAREATMPSEPSLFSVPDLALPGAWRHGLVYPLQVPAQPRQPARQAAILVSEWDMSLTSNAEPQLRRGDEFPVILTGNSFDWVSRKTWSDLEKVVSDKHQPWFEAPDSAARTRLLDAVHKQTDATKFDYGHILDYPIELREDIAATGAMWARGIRKWFLPHGFDLPSVRAYLDMLAGLDEAGRIEKRWWDRRRKPYRASKPAKD